MPNSSTRGFDAKLRCANSGLIILLSIQVVPVCLPIHHQYRRYSGELNTKPSALDLTLFFLCQQVSPNKTVNDPEEAANNGNFSYFFWLRFNPDSTNRVVLKVIFSGGGFSNNFKLPLYQAQVVHNWWNKFRGIYSSSQMNTTEKTRAFPVRVSIVQLHSCDIAGTCCLLTNPLCVLTGHFC